MTEDFVLQLAYSATYAPMHAGDKPPREVRVAHNWSRRLLAERYGWEEFQKLDGQVAVRRLFQSSRVIAGLLVGGMALYSMLFRGPHVSARARA
jgi:hypothetical protein